MVENEDTSTAFSHSLMPRLQTTRRGQMTLTNRGVAVKKYLQRPGSRIAPPLWVEQLTGCLRRLRRTGGQRSAPRVIYLYIRAIRTASRDVHVYAYIGRA